MAQEDELPPPKKKSKLKWIIMILLVLLLGGGAGAAYFMGFLDGFIGKGGSDEAGGRPSQSRTQIQSSPLFRLPEFLTNLSDPLGRRYVRVTVELELISPEIAKEVEAQNARIRDALIILLSSKSYAELSTLEGKQILRNQILDRINQILGSSKVVNVYYIDFVVQ